MILLIIGASILALVVLACGKFTSWIFEQLAIADRREES